MTKPNHHIIRQQVIELGLPNQKTAYRQQRHVSELFQAAVTKRLGSYFDSLQLGDDTLRIPKLEVDLGVFSAHTFDEQFIEKCALAIQKEVEKIMQSTSRQTVSQQDFKVAIPQSTAVILAPERGDIEALKQFLKTGTLPPLFRQMSWSALEQKWLALFQDATPALVHTLKILAQDHPQALVRLIKQFSPEWITACFTTILTHHGALTTAPAKTSEVNLPEEDILRGFLKQKLIVWDSLPHAIQVVLTQWLASKSSVNAKSLVDNQAVKLLAQLLQVFLTVPKNKWVHNIEVYLKALGTTEAERNQSSDLLTINAPEPLDKEHFAQALNVDYTHVELAGLVLLHPFLPAMFGQLGYLAGKEWLNQVQQERAMHLLVYLATGTEQLHEHHFQLAKVLVGWPINLPVNRQLVLSTAEQEEADRLLTAVLQHWKALKSSSLTGLREAFLKREGLIDQRTKDQIHVQVERKGQDILLDKLPWGFGFFKLPWLEAQVTVEW